MSIVSWCCGLRSPADVGWLTAVVDRVFLISDWYPSDDHPVAGAFVEEQALALAERYAITVVAPRRRQWRERPSASTGVRFEKRRDITVARIDVVPLLPRLRDLVYAAHGAAVRRAYRAAAERYGRPDLLHAHVIRYAGLSALALGRREALPVVLTEHSGPFGVHLSHPIDRRRVVRGLPQFGAVVAVSPFLRDQIAAAASVEIEVVGNVIDTDFFSPEPGDRAPSGDAFRILAVALLTPEKRMDLLIDAVAKCQQDRAQPLQLRIVGDGPERPALEQLVEERSLTGVVEFVGLADRIAVRDEMRRADAFVLASDAETFGVVLAEAMSCGLPVVATTSGGPDYIVQPGHGLLVPTGDAAALADAIARLMRDPAVVDVAAARASIVQRFGRRPFLDRIGDIYERVSRGAARARS